MHLHGSAPHGDNDDNSPQSASHCQQRGIVEAGGGAATGGKKRKKESQRPISERPISRGEGPRTRHARPSLAAATRLRLDAARWILMMKEGNLENAE